MGTSYWEWAELRTEKSIGWLLSCPPHQNRKKCIAQCKGVSVPSISSVNEDPICRKGNIPEVPGKGNIHGQMGGSLGILGGPFNLEKDSCQ